MNTPIIEIDTQLLSLMANKNIGTAQKKEGFNNLLKSYKENFNMEISTEYIRNLLISEGIENRKATYKVSNFIARNNIKPSVESIKVTMPLKWNGYGVAGFSGEDRINEKTLNFFVDNNVRV